jgi:hypothetical protein
MSYAPPELSEPAITSIRLGVMWLDVLMVYGLILTFAEILLLDPAAASAPHDVTNHYHIGFQLRPHNLGLTAAIVRDW